MLYLLATALLLAQDARTKADLITAADQLQAAIDAGDWKKAAELSSSLKDAIRDHRNRSLSLGGAEQVDTILAWLPVDTETVVVAQEPFTLVADKPDTMPDALTMARGYILGLLVAADDGKLIKTFQNPTLRLAVLTARKFANHPPDGSRAMPLGMIAYQGCAAYAFAKPLSEPLFSKPPETTIMGQPVWLTKGKQYEQAGDAEPRMETYLIAHPKPDLILACNNREFFTEVLTRMTVPPKTQAFPQSLPEWKHVDRSTPLWALRRFLPERAELDPTHPRNGVVAGDKDADATGVVVQFGHPTGTVRALWISKSKANPWQHLTDAADFGGSAKSHQLSDGVWELAVQGSAQAEGFAVFALMAVLGFAVLV